MKLKINKYSITIIATIIIIIVYKSFCYFKKIDAYPTHFSIFNNKDNPISLGMSLSELEKAIPNLKKHPEWEYYPRYVRYDTIIIDNKKALSITEFHVEGCSGLISVELRIETDSINYLRLSEKFISKINKDFETSEFRGAPSYNYYDYKSNVSTSIYFWDFRGYYQDIKALHIGVYYEPPEQTK